jgi:hypothetical protein
MLASINPLGERGRNQHYWITISAYLAASTIAGASLGALLGLAGSAIARSAAALGTIAAVAVLGLLLDTRVLRLRVPGLRRQVNENWLVQFRGWVYGAGFGAQLGVGFATIVTASATWVAFACALLSGTWLAGGLVGAVFGLARALPILSAARVRDPAALRDLVRRLERVRPRVALVSSAAQGAAAIGLIALTIGRVA